MGSSSAFSNSGGNPDGFMNGFSIQAGPAQSNPNQNTSVSNGNNNTFVPPSLTPITPETPMIQGPNGGWIPNPNPTGPVDYSNLPNQQGSNGSSSTPQQPTTNPIQSFIGSNTNPYANSTSPYFQAAQAQTLGNLAGAQQALQANRVNQNTAYGGLQYQQGVDQFGNPTWTANQTTNPQTQGLINSSLGSLQANVLNPAYGINPGETATNAIMRRLQPQMAQQAESQKAALANQGIVPGTQAYDNAMRTFNQQQNDLLTSAQTAGINTGLQAQQLQNQQAANIKSLTTPNFINAPTQATVAGPDYTGALATQTNANIAAQNAALGQATSNTAGLYGLGSAGILGLAANPGLLTSAGKGISSAYDWLSNQF